MAASVQSSSLLPVPEGDSLLSNNSSSEHHLDSNLSHDSHPEQKSGVLYRVKTTLAARFDGFFSPGSLKNVTTFINLVPPTEVVCIFSLVQLTYLVNTPTDCSATAAFHQPVPPVIRNR